MSPDKLKNLFAVGMLSLSAGLILHNFLHTRYSEFAAGVLIGMSIVFMIAGLQVPKEAIWIAIALRLLQCGRCARN